VPEGAVADANAAESKPAGLAEQPNSMASQLPGKAKTEPAPAKGKKP
jgi:hypothetical protein